MSEPAAAPASGWRRLLVRVLLLVGLALNFVVLLMWLAVAGFDLAGLSQVLLTPVGLLFFVWPLAAIILAGFLANRGHTLTAAVLALVSGLLLLLI